MERELEPARWRRKDDQALDAKKKQKDDEAFSKCKTPGARAKCDPDRFMNHYFLTDGKPDPLKTPEPLAVYGYGERYALQALAFRIPGLEYVSGGTLKNRIPCIGWDRDAVFALSRSVTAEARREMKKKQEARWEKAMHVHRSYLSQPNQNDSSQNSFELEQCRGSYIVECDEITDGWDDMPILTMDICDSKVAGTLTAAFHFGIFAGTMILSDSKQRLDDLIGPEDDSDSEFESDSLDEEDYEEDEEEEDDDKKTTSKKRSVTKAGEKSGPPDKRQKPTPTPSGRVFYRLRGRETGEGEIYPDPEPGHMDFPSDGYATFDGLAYVFPCLGDNVQFRGYKVSDTPKRRPKPWNSFTWEEHEAERPGLWF
ncbi:hypothetical protein NM208_g5017 [Fusarium decemcellulare]|uniref:Uncharacterized protein n=1 Tax=Fusarium decemcellulare TaxID=57161 RepID=A0ACC1SIM9_9HYPO|nr:hypothetical protein NM208_g5017 [Fusarium decemcellulare]